MKNELQSQQTGYQVVQDQDGKFRRIAQYGFFSSITPQTKAEKIAFMNLLDGDVARPMGEVVGAELDIADIIFKPYDSVDEETGEIQYGVNSFIITPDNEAYVTSSKTVYNTLKNLMAAFGEPHYSGEDVIKVRVVKKQGQQFKYVALEIIG